MAQTSGSVSLTVFETRRVIDRAFGRCKIPPQQITPEYIDTANDLLYLFLSTLSSKGLALWAVQKVILPLYESIQSVPCPLGTVDVLNANLRTSTRLTGIYTASGGTAANAFDGNLATACVQVTAAGNITIQFASATAPIVYGILPNATGSWNIAIQTSNDGIVWKNAYVNPALAVVAGQWFWVDIQGIPQAGVLYVRLQALGSTILNVTEFVQQIMPQEIPLAKINRDDYANLPNKWFPGRPVQFWYDKQIDQPLITLWPAPQPQFTFNQIVLYIQQYIQDVGTMTQSLAIPQRWFLAVVCELAKHLNAEIPEAKGDPVLLATEADLQTQLAWASETDSSPTTLRPNIRSYTR